MRAQAGEYIPMGLTYDNDDAIALLGFPIARLMRDKISLSRLICFPTRVRAVCVSACGRGRGEDIARATLHGENLSHYRSSPPL